MLDFSTLSNNVALMYTLLLIVFLLIYLAFFKKSPTKTKASKKTVILEFVLNGFGFC